MDSDSSYQQRQAMYERIWDQKPVPRHEIDLSFDRTIDGTLIDIIRKRDPLALENHLLQFSTYGINKDLKAFGTILIQCVKSGEPAMVEMALRYGASVNLGDSQNRTPLMYAAVNDRPDIMKILVDHGADLDQQVEGYGYTALHLASIQGAEKAVKFLIDRGCDTELAVYDGKDARDLAKNGAT